MPLVLQDAGGSDVATTPPPPPPSAPAPEPAPATSAPIPQPGQPLIDVGDGSLIVAPPVTSTVPAPAPAPTPSPSPAPAPQPIPQPGQPLIDVGDNTVIPAPPATSTAPAPPPPPAGTPPASPTDGTPAPHPIPQPGQPLIDVGDNTVIPAPRRTDAGAPPPPVFTPPPPLDDDVGDRSSPLDPEDGPDLGDRQLASANPVLRHGDAVDYIRSRGAHYNLDPLAIIANALEEGASGAVGDSGVAFGPWQTHLEDGRLRSFAHLPKYSDEVNTWAWSRDGFDYVFRSMVAGGAAGLRGHPAVHAIVYGFERPLRLRDADAARQDLYDRLVGLGGAVWDQAAAAFNGPVHTAPGLSPGAGGPAGGAAPTHEPSAGDVHTAWHDLMHTLGIKLPDVAGDIRTTRRAITRALT